MLNDDARAHRSSCRRTCRRRRPRPCGSRSFAGARIAPDMIWLSRLPTEAPSAAVMRTWYGPARDRAGADARAPAARAEARGDVPAEEEHHLCAVGGRRHGIGERDVRVLVARAAGIVVRVRRCAGERAAVQREDLPAELMPGGRAADPFESATTVGSPGTARVEADPPTQSAAFRFAQRSAVVCV